MPARRLDRNRYAVRVHDVLGMDVDDVRGLIGHVGLAAEEHAGLTESERIRMTDMQPPLVRGGGPDTVHVQAWVPLTDLQAEEVEVFINETANEYLLTGTEAVHQYVVRPHTAPITGEEGVVVARRFSCGGFVLEAYRFAGIDLLVTEEASLPPVSLEVLRQAYSDEQQLRVLDTPRLRDRFLGLSGDGPWPIVLPGYLFHSLARTEAEIRAGPYRARPGDEYFPAPTSP